MSAISDSRARSKHLDISFAPDVEQVSVIRRFVQEYYEPILGDPDLLARLAVVVHELLENAASYSADGECQLSIGIAVNAIIHGLGDATDPLDVYRKQLEAASQREGGSGLGLARIRGEAEMTLALDFAGNRVCVQAETSFEWKGRDGSAG
jgi:anti-sigma regulatory factor (Ser/Thr protein kinase)